MTSRNGSVRRDEEKNSQVPMTFVVHATYINNRVATTDVQI